MNNESIVKPRSHCTNCNHTLKWYELIPIVSYLLQHGKCRKCQTKIGVSSLIAEISLGTLFLLIYMRFGLTYDTLLGFIISMALLAIFISDFKEMVILDSTIVTSTILVYIITFMEYGIRGMYKSFLYGIFGFVLMFVIKILGDALFKRESLGGGDIKLAFLIGSILPYNLFLISLVVGSTVALPYALIISIKDKTHELPFGPFLMLGLLIVFFFKNDIINILSLLVV